MNYFLHPYFSSYFTGRGTSRLTIGRTVFVACIVLIVSLFSLLTGLVPKAGATGEQIVMGMPLDPSGTNGKWAYNVATTASCGYSSGQTAHPSCHGTAANSSDLLGYDWATDYYAASTTAVKLHGTSLQGTVTFSSVDAGIQSCGNGLTITANANGNSTGQIYVTHLDNSVVSSSFSNDAQIGTIHYQCFGVDHVHFSYKNTASNHACYVNYSNQTYKAGMDVSYGSPIGVLGASNTGVQQVCSSVQGANITPAAISFNSTLNVFKIGGDGVVYQNYRNGSTWNGFSSIGTGMTGNPAITVNGSAVNIFAIGNDGTVYTEYNSGSGWSGWTSMLNSQAMAGSPFVMHYGSSELDLYALGTNGTPYKDTWQSGSGWGGFTSMTGTLASNLSAIQYGSEMDVFGRNSSGTPYKDTWNGSGWTGWSTLSGTISGNIAAMPYSTYGEYDLWANTSGGDIFRKTWTGSTWVDWADYGGTFGGSPAAAQYGNDMYVINRASGDSTMWYKYWHYANTTWYGWAQWSSTSKASGDPSAYVDGSNLDVFITGTDYNTYWNTTSDGSTWSGFSLVN